MNSKVCLFLPLFFLCQSVIGKEKIVIDDFNGYKEGSFPSQWRGRSGSARKYYRIHPDANDKKNKFLRVENFDTAQFITKKAEVDIVKYPYLNWRWRARKIPPGGDESLRSKCDVGASVYVVLDYTSLFKIAKTIKYTWSTTLPIDTNAKSPFAFWPARTDIIVLQSGKRNLNKWIYQKRNILKDYKKLYKIKKLKSFVIKAIIVMSDGDTLNTRSWADYDDIFFSRQTDNGKP